MTEGELIASHSIGTWASPRSDQCFTHHIYSVTQPFNHKLRRKVASKLAHKGPQYTTHSLRLSLSAKHTNACKQFQHRFYHTALNYRIVLSIKINVNWEQLWTLLQFYVTSGWTWQIRYAVFPKEKEEINSFWSLRHFDSGHSVNADNTKHGDQAFFKRMISSINFIKFIKFIKKTLPCQKS